MCRLYGFKSTQPTRVECTLVHSQNALMVQSRIDSTGRSHGHGWGLAVYENHSPSVSREAWDAYQSVAFKDAAARVYSKAVIAHVRRATVGEARIENTHPFVHGEWSFAHNGTIPKFELLRPQMLDHMSEPHQAAIRGETDSEHLFRLFLSRLDDTDGDPTDALSDTAADVIGWCREMDADARIGLNVLATDGNTLIGLRWGRTLYHVQRSGVTDCEICRYPHILTTQPDGYRSLVVASEPLTHGETWLEIPEGSVFSAGADCLLSFRSLGLRIQSGAPSPVVSRAAPVRSTLIDEFMVDHRGLAEGLRRLIAAIEARDSDVARAEADRIDRNSGAHIAFEEADLYPAIGADPSMYDDHQQGLAVLREVLATDGRIPPSAGSYLIQQAEGMLDHMEDCGVLLFRVQTLTPLVQSELEERLLAWRVDAPRWTELSLVAHI